LRHVRVRWGAVGGRDPRAQLDVRARRLQERGEVGGDALLVELRMAVAQRAHPTSVSAFGDGGNRHAHAGNAPLIKKI